MAVEAPGDAPATHWDRLDRRATDVRTGGRVSAASGATLGCL